MSEPVTVVVDFKSPAACLAVAPTRALESRLGQQFTWLPFTAPGIGRPKPAAPDEDRGARHRRVRTEYLASDLRRYAESRGLDLGDVYRERDVTLASLGLLWLRHRAPVLAGDYVARVFDHLWQANAGAADLAFVETSLRDTAAGFREYTAHDGPPELATVREELQALGVWNVPAFLSHGEVFIGRQHLPMVEWLATGRAGPAPI
jgi:2-hydroxychromene-2-carboxylate isomerase